MLFHFLLRLTLIVMAHINKSSLGFSIFMSVKRSQTKELENCRPSYSWTHSLRHLGCFSIPSPPRNAGPGELQGSR